MKDTPGNSVTPARLRLFITGASSGIGFALAEKYLPPARCGAWPSCPSWRHPRGIRRTLPLPVHLDLSRRRGEPMPASAGVR
ncbi:MAG: hypothetical protein CBARDMAM_3056 [uncultured Caballeronia sp.]|nr:MAG: hypothetical protein CBARDMAM_3056 [uncultured Caballeronia sp.]